jgi:hypothetical protein
MTPALLADPIAEARRIIELAESDGVVLRALGGVAVCLQAPDGAPRLPRRVKDIDLAAAKGSGRPAVKVMLRAGYVADEMFNALRGSRRLLFQDPANGRHVDVFIGEFSMCHDIPMAARLNREPVTVPREELLLSKLQIFELTANDQADIYNLLFHNDVSDDPGGISASFIAALCAGDWGLWRTCQLNLERGLSSLGESALEPAERDVVAGRLERLRARIDAEPKSMKWRIRDRVGDRVRWYAEPEEEPAGA